VSTNCALVSVLGPAFVITKLKVVVAPKATVVVLLSLVTPRFTIVVTVPLVVLVTLPRFVVPVGGVTVKVLVKLPVALAVT
jgi:hypothetical protein